MTTFGSQDKPADFPYRQAGPPPGGLKRTLFPYDVHTRNSRGQDGMFRPGANVRGARLASPGLAKVMGR